MGRNYSSEERKELKALVGQYEASQANQSALYLDADQWAGIAEWYANERRFDEAQDAIDCGLEIHPGSTVLLVEQAFLYMDTDQVLKAKEVADSITDSDDFEVLLLKAELLLKADEPEKVQKMLNIRELPDELDILVSVAYLYLDEGYADEAKEWIDKGKSKYADEEDYLALIADYYALNGEDESAIEYYNKLIDRSPYTPEYWVGMAKCHYALEQVDKTIEACDFALVSDDCYGEAYVYKAHAYFYLNNSDKAIENYQKALELKAISPGLAYMFLGISYSNKEEWQKSNECFDKVLEQFEACGKHYSDMMSDIYTGKAMALSRMENSIEKRLQCEKLKETRPEEAAIYLTEGKLYLEEKRTFAAEASFTKALSIDPSIETLYIVASSYSDAGYLHDAIYYFEAVYHIDPKYEDVATQLSVVCLAYGDTDKFVKYNRESRRPLREETLWFMLHSHEYEEDEKKILKKAWKCLKKENENKRKGKK